MNTLNRRSVQGIRTYITYAHIAYAANITFRRRQDLFICLNMNVNTRNSVQRAHISEIIDVHTRQFVNMFVCCWRAARRVGFNDLRQTSLILHLYVLFISNNVFDVY